MNNRTHILGISAYYHDSAACLVTDGKIVCAAQEERFTRKKHDAGFPHEAVKFCLETAGITADDLRYVAFYDKPWIKFERLLETYITYAPRGLSSFLKSIPLWIKEKLWLGDLIKRELDYKGELLFPEHHQSHAASAFYPSPFEEAAVLTLDGVGEWATASYGIGSGNKLEIKKELKFPHSLGLLYSAFTYYLGFKVNSGEYKVMGLAPYGEPKYKDLIISKLMHLKEDGSFRLNLDCFSYPYGLRMTNQAFNEIFDGPPRKPETELTQKEMDIAASVQAVTEEIMLRMARSIREESGLENLCLAGGVALNCVGNGKILKENIFKNIWIQPAAGDAGGALGAAMFAWHQVMDKPRSVGSGDSQRGSYLGPEYKNNDVADWLKEKSYPHDNLADDSLADNVSQLLEEGSVVGWFSGPMEFGPRALGARSILGDARNTEMQKTMNLKIKYRESFRPFAPVVLREDVSEYFEMDGDSPYMLLVAPVKESIRKSMNEEEETLFGIEKLNVQRSEIPAVTHVDYSARVQTVDGKTNKRFHQLLQKFKEKTGVGVLINTSFNVRGEPIVCTPEDAYRCFMRTGMDALVIENCLLKKTEQPNFEDSGNWQEEFELD